MLLHHYPAEMNEIIERSEGSLAESLKDQRLTLGLDQGDAGLLLGRAWSLPPMVVNAMHHCHDCYSRGQEWEVTRWVGEVSELVHQVQLGNTELELSQVEKILGLKSSECRLDEIGELRQELLAVAILTIGMRYFAAGFH